MASPDSETERCLKGFPISAYPYPHGKTVSVSACLDSGPDGRLCIYAPGGGMIFVERKHIEGDIAPFSD